MRKIIILCVCVTLFIVLSACSNQSIKVPSETATPQQTVSPDINEKITKLDLGILLEGEISGAKYMVHVPDKWNGNLLIYAHGLKQAHEPIEVTLETSSPEHISMIENGWIIASTSYRRNGWIVNDAIKDIDNLKDHIERKYGKSKISIVQGYSMGGLIAARMAERDNNEYSGFLAIGAVYDISVTYKPQRPVIFLSNHDELDFPLNYSDNVKDSGVKPAVWKVSRDGHCNVSGKEVEVCIDGLLNWIEKDEIVYEKDVTLEDKTSKISDASLKPLFDLNGNYTGFSDLPLDYSIEEAKNDGHFVTQNLDIVANKNVWDNFVETSLRGENTRIRIVKFYIESTDSPYFLDLIYEDGYYYYFDSSAEINKKQPYSYLLILEGKFGNPLRDSGVVILTDDNTLTFETVMRVTCSSSMEYINSVSPFRIVMFK